MYVLRLTKCIIWLGRFVFHNYCCLCLYIVYTLLFYGVIVLPHIVPFSVDEKVRSGDSIQLNCHVSKGDKPLELNWLFNDEELSSELSVTTTKLGSSSSVLTISTVSAAHTGKYTCIASNRIGSYDYSTYINVDGTHFNFNKSFACDLALP